MVRLKKMRLLVSRTDALDRDFLCRASWRWPSLFVGLLQAETKDAIVICKRGGYSEPSEVKRGPRFAWAVVLSKLVGPVKPSVDFVDCGPKEFILAKTGQKRLIPGRFD